jgi:hypothetical protein
MQSRLQLLIATSALLPAQLLHGARKAEHLLVAQYFKKIALISASLLSYY